MDWVKAQKEVAEWRGDNFFGVNRPTLLHQMAGATGECAEGMQDALKLEDQRRDNVDNDLRLNRIADAIGDTLIYLMGAADILDMDLEDCFKIAWREVKNRTQQNWEKNDA